MADGADEDHELMAAVARGDAAALRRLVDRHAAWSVAFAERMVGTRADAEDLVQAAFLRVWRSAAKWEPAARFRTWFYRVLYNLCMDHFRANAMPTEGVDEALPDGAPTGEERYAAVQRADRVRAAVAALPARQRAAIVLCYYQGLSQADAAAALGVSEGALESLLSRARAALRKAMQHELH
jgi:RNA polymerase sigma-70 factor (ECF subfamily)